MLKQENQASTCC